MSGVLPRLGLSTIVALTIVACTATSGPISTSVPTESVASAVPRGAGGILRVHLPRAVTILNSHLGQSGADFDAARLALEPLAAFGSDGKLVPVLAHEVPTIANGGVSRDLRTVTWKLKPNVKWSDGSEFTAADVVFTHQFIADPKTGATTRDFATGFGTGSAPVKSVEAIDRLTVRITYERPNPDSYQIFVRTVGHVLQEKQFKDHIGARAKDAPGNQRPVGTGPYKVKEFRPDGFVSFEINEHYREPGKPFFREIMLTGGGDPVGTARAVFETGALEYAPLAVTDDVLKALIASPSSKAILVGPVGGTVERLLLNRADPSASLGDERAEPNKPHPFLSDIRVRTALAKAVDRDAIAATWGLAGEPTCNILTGIAGYVSRNTATMDVCRFDIAAANGILDEAGWLKGVDGIRMKSGTRLKLVYQTTVDPLRQRIQAIIKDGWSKIGVETELKAVESGRFFGREGPDTVSKFFADVQMIRNTPGDPAQAGTYLAGWTSAEIRTRAANWSGSNYERWSSKDYDALFEQLLTEIDEGKRTELIVRMNDLLVSDVVVVPLVAQKQLAGVSKELKGVLPGVWDSRFWNIADWRK